MLVITFKLNENFLYLSAQCLLTIFFCWTFELLMQEMIVKLDLIKNVFDFQEEKWLH